MKSDVQKTANVKVGFALDNKIPAGELVSGTVNGSRVSTILRDTGCSCFVVSDKLIPDKIYHDF